MKVVSYIHLSIDQNQGVFLGVPDLSAAFDTIDFDIVVGRLASRLGICGVVLQWLNLYLCSHTQTMTVCNMMSVLAELLFGVH